jgi:hypothetical protein
MRGAVILAGVVISVLAVEMLPSSAQSAYDYPWCGREYKFGGGATSCYFTSYQQCRATMLGIGGYCYHNPAYRGRGRLYR